MTTHAHLQPHAHPWFQCFLGHAPLWYKRAVLVGLILNPLLYLLLAWILPAERATVAVLGWEGHLPPQGTGLAAADGAWKGRALSAFALGWRWGHGGHAAHDAEILVALESGAAPSQGAAVPVRVGDRTVNARVVALHADRIVAGGERSAGFVVGWLMVAQFIGALALALSCYPLLPGGLIALEALAMGLVSPWHLYHEAATNFPVILLLIFVVAGVSFLKEWLSVVFTRLLLLTRSKIALSLLFCGAGALLSAFLDALTVIAVVIAVGVGFWNVYHDWRSRSGEQDDAELEQFRSFLRSLVMHAAIGTALGGVCTLVGEPQNLLIAHTAQANLPPERAAHWDFLGFFIHMVPVAIPTLVLGLLTTVVVERLGWFGYGAGMPERVRTVLAEHADAQASQRSRVDRWRLVVQGICALLLVVALALHVAEVGIIGLFLIVLATAFTGVSEEHRIGHAFTESLPFTALLVVFFAVVSLIAAQDLFRPVIALALAQEARGQLAAFFVANAALSAISDNVFVATVFVHEATDALHAGQLGSGAAGLDQYERLAITINAGTNLPSVATPNGQAALLFLLTSSLAPLIRLGYLRMLWMAVPYTLVMTGISFAAVMMLS